jgi:hypothetical protein
MTSSILRDKKNCSLRPSKNVGDFSNLNECLHTSKFGQIFDIFLWIKVVHDFGSTSV